MKKPNGFGSVYKMGGRRRRPYRAVVSVGYDRDGRRIRQTLGYYETKKDALSALGVYNAAPYELKRLRFSDVYRMWSEEKFGEISASSVRAYTAAFGHARALHAKIFRDLRTVDLENCIRAAELTPAMQQVTKMLFSQMYRYALRYDLVQRNYAAEVKTERIAETEKRHPFTDDEIKMLWDMSADDDGGIRGATVRMVLIGIYSGWRPSELCTYELDDGLMYGGSKTESGKNRVVPVHPLVSGFVGMARPKAAAYYIRFKNLMASLGWDHTPHDTRRTFATLAARAGMDENVRKLIMGHRNGDLTERVYTTHAVDELKREMLKIGRI